MTPEEYCQDKAAKSGSSFYYSFLFLPDEQRKAITALYAFCREVDDVVDMPLSHGDDSRIKKVKLGWWHSEVEELYAGSPTHPVTKALQPWLEKFNLEKKYLLEIIAGMEMDIEPKYYQTFEELYQYCYRAAGVVGILSANIFGFTNPKTLEYAENLGIAFQLTNIIRDVYEDCTRGRVYIPVDEIIEAGLELNDILHYPTNKDLTPLFKKQAQRAQSYYEKAFDALPEQDRYPQRSGIIMAAIYQKTLDEIIRDNYQVMKHRISLTPLRKLWIAWRSARKEKRRMRRTRDA